MNFEFPPTFPNDSEWQGDNSKLNTQNSKLAVSPCISVVFP